MANVCHGFVHSPPSRASLVPAILTCGRDQHPVCWRESSEQHCPLNHLVQWKALSARKHTVSKPVITRELRCLNFQMRTTAPTEEFPSHCFCLASCEWHRLAAAHSQDHCSNHAIGVDETWAEDLLLSGLHQGPVCMFCPFQTLDPVLHKAAFFLKGGRKSYCIHQRLAEISCTWHQEQQNKPYLQSLFSFKLVYRRASSILLCL